MTCSDADESCPVVSGAEYRTSITYKDPKIADGTKDAEDTYESRSRQIGIEMLYVFKRVSKL
jgi:arsenate reductase